MLTYNIFDDVLELRNLVDNFFRDVPARGRSGEYPHVDIYENDAAYEVRAILPGVKPEDVSVELADNSIIIEGEKKRDYSEHPYIRKERDFGKFKKSVKLPTRVNSGNVQAEMKNGILFITLTKSEDAKPKRIEIH
ncbi:MAG TPA: Hsp20/alpha crystallin family protein [Spirochaetota bacterium]|nr:Hsp20/alpha crystallin family protein [Spirochaetota bacterium]HPI88224.1 Hsp20/alpha crystallin family protein [Spirochaetota bacterium]HPR47232.1 Hsp20/alpha crystallin family protein [Spirochaetota bacterium]